MICDLQHHFEAEGRTYVIEVRWPSTNQAPLSAGSFDAHIAVDVAEILLEWRQVEPERVVRQVTNYVVPLVPASVKRDDWTWFADVVLAWVCEHREAKS